MPKENVCPCGVVVDLPKSRNNVVEKLTIFLPKTRGNKSEGKGSRKQHDDGRVPKTRISGETGSSSSVQTEPARPTMKSNKHEKRLTHSRRTRSADRAESHYTYIDSGSSILGSGIQNNTIPEVLYATIPDTPNASVNETGTSRSNSQNRSQPIYPAIPSMTSPPPTYDVAIAKTWQTGLPPTYEEYLCHKYAMMSRSHTPPPPWSDSTTTALSSSSNPTSSIQARRDFLASQPELREYLLQLTLSDRFSQYQQQRQQPRDTTCSVPREQQVRVQQRTRAMPPRSQSENRAQQQRIAAMYTDAAFGMETAVLQSAFESAGQGLLQCNLM